MPMAQIVTLKKTEKLSMTITPKPTVLRSHSSVDVTTAPVRPMMPSQPIGMRSPWRRNDSARRTAHADRTTRRTGTMGMIWFSMASALEGRIDRRQSG
jgi:hypothetical protein